MRIKTRMDNQEVVVDDKTGAIEDDKGNIIGNVYNEVE